MRERDASEVYVFLYVFPSAPGAHCVSGGILIPKISIIKPTGLHVMLNLLASAIDGFQYL